LLTDDRDADVSGGGDVSGSPLPESGAYMSDGDYEAISSDDELIDIDTELVGGVGIRRKDVIGFRCRENSPVLGNTTFRFFRLDL